MPSLLNRPRTLSLHNGREVEPTFSVQEMDTRRPRLRTHMAEQGIDHVLFTTIHNVKYFGDFVYTSFGRPYGLVVTEERCTSISANIDGGQPWRQTVGDNLVYTDWHKDNFYFAVGQLETDGGRVGIEFDHVSLEMREKLVQGLPGSELVDAGMATMSIRMIKSREELALIRDGARIADLGGAACVEAIGQGVPEYEVALHSTRTMVREIARCYPHTELMDTWTWLQSGINTDGGPQSAHHP